MDKKARILVTSYCGMVSWPSVRRLQAGGYDNALPRTHAVLDLLAGEQYCSCPQANKLHRDELVADQMHTSASQQPYKIEPLSSGTIDWDLKTLHALPDHKLAVEPADGRRDVFELRPFLNRVRLGALTWPREEDIAPSTMVAHLEFVAVA